MCLTTIFILFLAQWAKGRRDYLESRCSFTVCDFWTSCVVFILVLVNPSVSESTLNVVFKWKRRATQGHNSIINYITIIR